MHAPELLRRLQESLNRQTVPRVYVGWGLNRRYGSRHLRVWIKPKGTPIDSEGFGRLVYGL